MIKKIVLILILVFSFNSVLVVDNQDAWATDWWWNNNSWDNNWNSSACSWQNCLNSTEFMIETSDITPTWKKYNENSSSITETSNNILSTVIENLMIAIWVIALLVMSIWAWYMIFYHWQDEMLSKWKTMFTTWITALIIALTSYYLVSLVRYILYTWN